jgi:hypothetical protein
MTAIFVYEYSEVQVGDEYDETFIRPVTGIAGQDSDGFLQWVDS